MKKLILTAIATVAAVSVFAQGTITFNNYVPGKIQALIYAPQAGATSLSQIGNGATGVPAGTTVWTGFSPVVGPGVWAALLGAPGLGMAESSLLPASSGGVTSFRSGTGSGILYATTPTFGNIPADAASATLEMVAWDNSSGLYSTWALASEAWKAGTIVAGVSGTFDVLLVGGNVNTPPNVTGLRSFNMYNLSTIPEPSTFALAGLGAAALLILRRRK